MYSAGIREHDGSTLLSVRLFPKAPRNEIVGVRGGALIVKVTAPPEQGKANAALCKLLAESLRIASGKVKITRGATSRNKQICIEALSPNEVSDRLGLPPSVEEQRLF